MTSRWYVEELELTIAHLGLGPLSEVALMRIFGDVHSHRITRGTGNSISGIVDQKGRALYPGNYFTHLRVPPSQLLESYPLWERVAVAVDVSMLAWILLDTNYVLGRPGQLAASSNEVDLEGLPSMRGSVTLMVDGKKGEPEVCPPKAGVLASDLRRISRTPSTMDAHRTVRAQGRVDTSFAIRFKHREPIVYPVVAGRDAAVGFGRHTAVQFATFLQIMDIAERQVLTEHIVPAFPGEVVDALSVIERETYYFRNCTAGDVLGVHVAGRFDPTPDVVHGDLALPAVLTCMIEIYDMPTNELLVASKVRKVAAIPLNEAAALREASVLAGAHGAPNSSS